MWRGVKWLVLWSLWAARVVRQPTAAVRVGGGWLRGSVGYTGSYAEYLAIPYATVVNRFQGPGPEPTFHGVFEAINENVRCSQTLFKSITIGQEDCLTLNVYTPIRNAPLEPLPVMVFIHGGSFLEGSASRQVYGPEYLVNKGIVLVTINYRLNVPGFLCLGIKEAPGNAGMKDQVMALKWVQRNIRAFGGDPDNVTIFGESAGSASVSLHVLSPMSKGLFHKAIQQSGSSLGSWVIQYDPIETALFKAKAVGFTKDSKDPHEIYNFFMSKTDTEIITRLTQRKEGNIILSRLLYTPCVEQKIEGVEPFLTELPHKILTDGEYNKVPMIIGSNSEEGLLFVNMEDKEYFQKIDFYKSMPKDLRFPSQEIQRQVSTGAKQLYLGNDEISLDNAIPLSRFYGEPFFNYPCLEETEMIVKSNDKPVYHYLFKYDGWRNVPQFMVRSNLRMVSGATHADELFYMFSQDVIPKLFEWRMIEVVSTMWTNFAKYGDPTPSLTDLLPVRWPVISKDIHIALVIDQHLTTASMWYNRTLLFWKNVYSKYRRKS